MNQPQHHHHQGAQDGTTAMNSGNNPKSDHNAAQIAAGFQQAMFHGAGSGNSGPGMNSQIMGQLMTNPALAAAAAASPLFPPAALMTNPGAFLTMPEYYTSAAAVQNDQKAKDSAAAINAANPTKPQQVTSSKLTQPIFNPVQMQQQSAHNNGQLFNLSGVQHPIMPCGAALSSPGIISNQIAPSSVQAYMAASAAASQVLAGEFGAEEESGKSNGKRKKDMTPAERAKTTRERNREHARSTRIRKKAYIQKLKELVEGLHAERTEEVRQRRVAIQHLAEMQNVRRAVIQSFLRFHSNYERDKRKWETILEDSIWLKQPVTPYRCFRRSEIEQECRMSRGVDAVVADAASVAAMIEGVGSRTARWVQIKREDFLIREEERTGRKLMPKNIVRQNNRFRHAVSSLSSSSSSSNNGSSGEEANKNNVRTKASAAGEGDGGKNPLGEFHDYHAKPLPDPKILDQDRNSSSPSAEDDSPEDLNSIGDTKRISTDTSSGDDCPDAIKENESNKRRKIDFHQAVPGGEASVSDAAAPKTSGGILPPNIAKKGGIAHNIVPVANAATKNGNARLAFAPAVPLPPFAGIGKKSNLPLVGAAAIVDPSISASANAESDKPASVNGGDTSSMKRRQLGSVALDVPAGPAVVSADFETSSSNSSRSKPQTRAYYHVNEDDVILMEDVIMCPFVLRTQDAVLCGALAECVMPGMLRGHFSSRNKLMSVEMIYDSMGFMQQLERASGSELMAQVIPGSLEMALCPGSPECRVITMAEYPYRIVNVNKAWTKLTKYSQMEAEGIELFSLLDPPSEEGEPTSPVYDLDEVVGGRCKCATRFHSDKNGREFVDFISSYPLTNASDEITHILHISKELPQLDVSDEDKDSSGMEEVNDENP